ncbi:hypothetical protein H4S07_000962 [Coemansia furcata]|uniref:Uncharacterized protein n=1 Tax=Coemansia furcata TaxID=417177 RepID=A0ACC1LPN2_9FUNG|nr:hypothetical protein H4S07_000962 [Coemansia furcata]
MHRWIRNSIIEADTNEEAVLLVGDLNPSTDSPTQAEQAMRRRLENHLAFKEAWWHCNGRTNDDTHTKQTANGTTRRKLDFVFLSGWLDNIVQCSKSTRQSLLGEDHDHLWVETTGYVQVTGAPQTAATSRPRLAFHQAKGEAIEAFKKEMEQILIARLMRPEDPEPETARPPLAIQLE